MWRQVVDQGPCMPLRVLLSYPSLGVSLFAALQSGLGRARGSMLQWLLDCLNPVAQASTTRAKAVKALGEVRAASLGSVARDDGSV